MFLVFFFLPDLRKCFFCIEQHALRSVKVLLLIHCFLFSILQILLMMFFFLNRLEICINHSVIFENPRIEISLNPSSVVVNESKSSETVGA
jgi:hypothetical protein